MKIVACCIIGENKQRNKTKQKPPPNQKNPQNHKQPQQKKKTPTNFLLRQFPKDLKI